MTTTRQPILSVLARMDRIWTISLVSYSLVRMINERSSRSTGMPWADLYSVPLLMTVSSHPIPHCAHTSVGSEDDDRSEGGLQGSIQVREGLDVQHVHLIDEQDARHQLGHTLLDVLVDHLVDLLTQLVCDLRLPLTDQLGQNRRDVLTALRSSVRHIQVVKSHILDLTLDHKMYLHNLLLLVHIALGKRHVLISLQIEFC